MKDLKMKIMKRRLLYTLAILFVSLQTFAQSTKNKYEYDDNNRLSKITYSNGVTVSYTYDALGNRLSKKVTGAAPIKKGDVNCDDKVTITDAVSIVNFILGNPSDGFNVKAADVNGDGKVSITDAVGVVNIILNQGGESAAPARQSEVETEKTADPE